VLCVMCTLLVKRVLLSVGFFSARLYFIFLVLGLGFIFLHWGIHIPLEIVLPMLAWTIGFSWFLQKDLKPVSASHALAGDPYGHPKIKWIASLVRCTLIYSEPLVRKPVWIGRGAAWTAEHSNALHDGREPAEALNCAPARQFGAKKVEMDPRLLSRNGLALGSPGSGKTQLLLLLAEAAQERGESVWLIDPKGSARLYQRLREGAARAGRPFFALIPQRAEESVQYDPLRHCLSGIDIATRLVSLIPGDEQDVFKHFCWGVLVTLTEAMFMLGERPSIAALSAVLPEAGECLLPRVEHYLEGTVGHPYRGTSSGAFAGERCERRKGTFLATKNALEALVKHDRTHYKKMIVPLRSVFELLCRGSLGQVLGAERAYDSMPLSLDVSVARHQQATVYIGLDALVNPHIAKAMASLILEDIAADASRGIAQCLTVPPQLLLVDEAGEVACEALLQLLGKGRECGVQTWFAVQTLSDLEWRLGGAAAARVAEGNAGAWFLFRQLDAISRRESERRLGTLPIARRSASLGTSFMRRGGNHYESDSVSDGFTRETVPRIPEAVFSCLEDLECFAHFPDGSLFHLRLPVSF